MEVNEYQKLAMKTWSKRLHGEEMLINGVMGLCGEAGETIDLVKKYLHQGHELNREKVIEELGDVCWYIFRHSGLQYRKAGQTVSGRLQRREIDSQRGRAG